MAFEALSDRLGRILKKRRGQATLTEKNRDDRLGEVRKALLEADVNYDVVNDFIGDVLHFSAVIPEFIEFLKQGVRNRSAVFHNSDISVVSPVTTQVNSCKAGYGIIVDIINIYHSGNNIRGNIRAESHFLAYPVSTFTSDSFLRQFVAEFYLEFCSV